MCLVVANVVLICAYIRNIMILLKFTFFLEFVVGRFVENRPLS